MSFSGRLEDSMGMTARTRRPEAHGRRSVGLDCNTFPLVHEISPAPDPVDAFERLASLPHVLFFDSAQYHPFLAQYSFLMADPFEWIWSRGRRTFFSGKTKSPANAK